jgi:hypothetical protein
MTAPGEVTWPTEMAGAAEAATPDGASATPAGAGYAVRLSGLIAAPDGSSVIRAQATGVAGDGEALGRRLAHLLLRDGGARLLGHTSQDVTDQKPPAAHAVPGRRVSSANYRLAGSKAGCLP